MVEGGARVLRSFIVGGLADQAVITVSPAEMDGVSIFGPGAKEDSLLAFVERCQEKFGPDTVTWGRFPKP
jgi:riboflavin biosynthesis pyrimidine reductase